MLKTFCILGCMCVAFVVPGQALQNTALASWEKNSPYTAIFNLNGEWRQISEDGALARTSVPGVISDAGEATLTKRFFLPDSLKNKAIRLHALGINYNCSIEVNGSFVAGHDGGYTSFNVDLNPNILLFNAQNTITIQVDNELTATSTLPFKHRPLRTPGHLGILRGIYLEAIPIILIDDFTLRPSFGSSDGFVDIDLSVEIRVFNESLAVSAAGRTFDVYAEISEKDQAAPPAKSDVKTFDLGNSSNHRENLQLRVKPQALWAPDAPALLDLKFILSENDSIIHQISAEIGLREIALSGKRFLLNQQPFVVRGIDIMENLSGFSGARLDSAVTNLFRRAKGIGVNAVRIAGGPGHPAFLRQCAREGLFVLEEIPVDFATAAQLALPEIRQKALERLGEMIQRDKNNPAVFAWGVGTNLQDDAPQAREFIRTLAERARQLDGRPIYIASRSANAVANQTAVDFVLFDNFGQNEPGFDASRFTKPVLPIIGFFAESPYLSKQEPDLSRRRIEAEELQAAHLESAMKSFAADQKQYSGSFIRALNDWRTSSPITALGADRDLTLSPAGLVREDGSLRIGYRVVAAQHLGERKPPISPNEIVVGQPTLFTFSGIGVILLFLFLLNRDKKFRSLLRRAYMHSHGFYADVQENRKVPVFATFFLGLLQGVIFGTILASIFFAYKDSLIFDEILTMIFPDPAAKAILVSLVWHPGWMLASVAALYFVLMSVVALFFRILGLVFRNAATFRQHFTLIFWSAICYLPLAILTPVVFRFSNDRSFVYTLAAILSGAFVWHYFRLQRGIRVLYVFSPFKSVILLLSLGAILIFGGLYGWDRSQAIFDYCNYYWSLLK